MTAVRLAVIVVLLAVAGTLLWVRRDGAPSATVPPGLRHTERLTLAFAGDTVAGPRFVAAALNDVRAVLQQASLALTDLDQSARSANHPPPASARPSWPVADEAVSRGLRALGFGIVTMANEHTSDDQGASPIETAAVLNRVGLLTAGGGADQDRARAAAIVGDSARRIAVLDITTSVSASGRASRSRGDILGRPGVNALRYSAVVIADPATFVALSQMARTLAPQAESGASDDSVTLSGTTIRRGTTTSVELVVDSQDVSALMEDIKAARLQAEIVVVSMHTHEPDNRTDVPAAFVRDVAHRAIDAGAALVIGHGTRQLRGIEVYGGGAIAYGLGSFVFERTAIPEGAGTVFDSDVSAYDLALGAIQRPETLHMPRFDEPGWWESVIVTATFNESALESVVLTPLDLGADASAADRGLPRVATGKRGEAILGRLTRLSSAFGTTMTSDGDRGLIRIGPVSATPSR